MGGGPSPLAVSGERRAAGKKRAPWPLRSIFMNRGTSAIAPTVLAPTRHKTVAVSCHSSLLPRNLQQQGARRVALGVADNPYGAAQFHHHATFRNGLFSVIGALA